MNCPSNPYFQDILYTVFVLGLFSEKQAENKMRDNRLNA